MPFDQTALLWSILVPVVIATGAFALGRIASRFPSYKKARIDIFTFAFGWWVSIAIALYGRQGWPQAEWQLCLWPLIIWAVFAWFSSVFDLSVERPGHSTDNSWRWILVAVASGLTSLTCLPRGEIWTDSYHLHGPWGVLLTLAMLINAWSLDCMSRRNTERWVLLVTLASFGGPVALAAATYGSLTEWSVAMVSVTLVFSVAGLLVRDSQVCAIAPLAAAAGTCIIAAGRFQTFQDYPAWIYGLMLLLPACVAGLDFVLRKQPTWQRVLIASTVSIAIIATCIWYLLIRQTESW